MILVGKARSSKSSRHGYPQLVAIAFFCDLGECSVKNSNPARGSSIEAKDMYRLTSSNIISQPKL